MSDASSAVLIENESAVRTVRLNRPDVLNACNDDLLGSLAAALKDAERDESVRCVVLTGAGRAFCSGQDLDDVKRRNEEHKSAGGDQPIELGDHLRHMYHPVIARIRAMEKPVIAAVNGVAAGAGCSLALAADVRIAAESASFIEVFINVGLVPDSGSTFMLPRLIGVSRAMELCFTGRKVGAAEALALGLCSQVVPDDQLAETTMKLAGKLASLPTRAIGLTKRAINAAWTHDLDTQLEYEAQLQTVAGKTHDHREGVTAFLEKRKPEFTGQ